MKNRLSVMRYVVLHGRLWDDLYIGFQNRIRRDPDIYHYRCARTSTTFPPQPSALKSPFTIMIFHLKDVLGVPW